MADKQHTAFIIHEDGKPSKMQYPVEGFTHPIDPDQIKKYRITEAPYAPATEQRLRDQGYKIIDQGVTVGESYNNLKSYLKKTFMRGE